MQYAQVRVSLPYEKIEDLVGRLKEASDIVVGYQHDPDQGCARPHCHFLLGNFNKTKVTFYNWCKQIGLLATDYQFSYNHSKKCQCCNGKKLVDKSFISYESKGKLEPVGGLKGISVEEVGEWRDRWVDRTQQLRITRDSGDGSLMAIGESSPVVADTVQKVPRCTRRQLLNEMIARLSKHDDHCDGVILDVIRETLVAEGEPVSIYKALEYRDSIIMHIDENNWKHEALGIISKRNSRY